jgi:hypothetical protein
MREEGAEIARWTLEWSVKCEGEGKTEMADGEGAWRGFDVFWGISSPSNIFFSYPTCSKPTIL